jgi:hypothetical protein
MALQRGMRRILVDGCFTAAMIQMGLSTAQS